MNGRLREELAVASTARAPAATEMASRDLELREARQKLRRADAEQPSKEGMHQASFFASFPPWVGMQF
jgi:hypothetical protein